MRTKTLIDWLFAFAVFVFAIDVQLGAPVVRPEFTVDEGDYD